MYQLIFNVHVQDIFAYGQPLKKLFPVYRPGEYVRADWKLFIFIFAKKNNNIFISILLKKKEKGNFF